MLSLAELEQWQWLYLAFMEQPIDLCHWARLKLGTSDPS